MSITCLNCGSIVSEKFCPNCGQKREVEKITWTSMILEVFHFFSHIEKGFFRTSCLLLIRPDKVINEYLEGKRKKYFKPVSLYLIWVSIHLLAFSFIPRLIHYNNLRTSVETQSFYVQHTSIFGILLLPVMSFFSWLIISRPKLNYLENFVAILYSYAVVEMLAFLQIFITGLILRVNFLTDRFLIQVQIVVYTWGIYFCFLFFRNRKIKFLIPRIALALALSFIINEKVTMRLASLVLNLVH